VETGRELFVRMYLQWERFGNAQDLGDVRSCTYGSSNRRERVDLHEPWEDREDQFRTY